MPVPTASLVDAKSGRKRWSRGANGRATFTEIASYGRDKYVVVTDMSGYDRQFMACEKEKSEGKAVKCQREDQDIVELMRDETVVGRADFPPNARLAVVGKQVWALSPGKDAVTVQKIMLNKRE